MESLPHASRVCAAHKLMKLRPFSRVSLIGKISREPVTLSSLTQPFGGRTIQHHRSKLHQAYRLTTLESMGCSHGSAARRRVIANEVLRGRPTRNAGRLRWTRRQQEQHGKKGHRSQLIPFILSSVKWLAGNQEARLPLQATASVCGEGGGNIRCPGGHAFYGYDMKSLPTPKD